MSWEGPENEEALRALYRCWQDSPYPSLKVSSYFPVYVELFGHLRGTSCTFIETGILDGGSLFMWRQWLGDKARIIGVDLNPDARRWAEYGFEIEIGDQGDPVFWREFFQKIGHFDALLDDGGHQSFQQIVTVYEALGQAPGRCVIAVEDTVTSFMKDFARHGRHTFLEFAKDSTDVLIGRARDLGRDRLPAKANIHCIEHYRNVYSIRFFYGIVAYIVNDRFAVIPETVRNRPANAASDFRYNGVASATVDWPHPFRQETVQVQGGAQRNVIGACLDFISNLWRRIAGR